MEKRTPINSNLYQLVEDICKSETFDIRSYVHDGKRNHPCGTPACIAGHATVRWADMRTKKEINVTGRMHDGHIVVIARGSPFEPDWEELANFLGVNLEDFADLCLPNRQVDAWGMHHEGFCGFPPEGINNNMAAAALLRLAKGERAYFSNEDRERDVLKELRSEYASVAAYA